MPSELTDERMPYGGGVSMAKNGELIYDEFGISLCGIFIRLCYILYKFRVDKIIGHLSRLTAIWQPGELYALNSLFSDK